MKTFRALLLVLLLGETYGIDRKKKLKGVIADAPIEHGVLEGVDGNDVDIGSELGVTSDMKSSKTATDLTKKEEKKSTTLRRQLPPPTVHPPIRYYAENNGDEWYRFRWNEEGEIRAEGDTEGNSDWMSHVPDSTKFTQLSLPGTHDTMTYKDHILEIARCQSIDLLGQLRSGIRALDIRCKTIGTGCSIYHGDVPLGFWMSSGVLSVIRSFLQDNPSEFIFMRVKRESSNPGTVEEFNAMWLRYRNQYRDLFPINNWRYTDDENHSIRNTNPTLGELRGTVAWIYTGSWWSSQSYSLQDEYNLVSKPELYYGKWIPIKDMLDASRLGSSDGSSAPLYVNFLSAASISVYPWWVASGHSDHSTEGPNESTGKTTPFPFLNDWPDFPRVWPFLGSSTIAYEGTNKLFGNRLTALAAGGDKIHTGIVYADFPGKALINTILQQNLYQAPEMMYTFTIDCNLDSLDNEDTGSRIRVEFINGNNLLLKQWNLNGMDGCNQQRVMTMTYSDNYHSYTGYRAQLAFVRITTEGSDAFAIDQAWIKEKKRYSSEEVILRFGRNNGGYFCLSTDSTEWDNHSCSSSKMFMFKDWFGWNRGQVYSTTHTY